MRISRGTRVWAALACCAVLVAGAMTWLTRGALAAERERALAEQERAAAEARADLEERTRLALWRMDAQGAAIVLRENRIPADRYQAPPPWQPQPEVLLHFEIRRGGSVSSPDVDARAAIPLADRMARLRALLAANPLPDGDEWEQLHEAAVEGESQWRAVAREAPLEEAHNALQRQSKSGAELRKDAAYQSNVNVTERAQRAKALAQSIEPPPAAAEAAQAALTDQRSEADDIAAARRGAVAMQAGPMRAIWLGGELFLLRQISQTFPAAASRVQGVWLDAGVLRRQLLGGIEDLLPHAELRAVDGMTAAADPLAMVSFPFRLERNESPVAAASPVFPRPPGAPLWLAWGAAGLAVLAGAVLVHGIMRLSERRASFVSAVTHELRTPLTTFRLYADMLDSGAVKEEKRGEYLKVLSREADRLSHLVENVLAFSGIERGNARSVMRDMAAGGLLENSRERLGARLATAGLRLDMDTSCMAPVRADTAAVEHILFNLIDNAAKYAAGGEPPVVAIAARPAGRFVDIEVRDHGPGIPADERERIFRAFHKSAREAAESKPGVGLGLALSRRLAEAQGGRLTCGVNPPGASFVLRLPAA